MGFVTGVTCDKCGRSQIRFCHEGKVFITKWAREEGWKIGKLCTCPECAKSQTKPKAAKAADAQ